MVLLLASRVPDLKLQRLGTQVHQLCEECTWNGSPEGTSLTMTGSHREARALGGPAPALALLCTPVRDSQPCASHRTVRRPSKAVSWMMVVSVESKAFPYFAADPSWIPQRLWEDKLPGP